MQVMQHPDFRPMPLDLVDRVLRAVAPENGEAARREVLLHGEHSNDVAEVRLVDGRTLMLKRGRYPWAAARFATSRLAARMFRTARAVAPAPLPLPDDLHDRPLEAYWRIDLPTLQELWPRLGAVARRDAVTSWGAMVRRVHAVPVAGYGPLCVEGPALGLAEYLGADLAERLLPAVQGVWLEGREPLLRLIDRLGELVERIGGRPPALVHGDLHAGNVLCEEVAAGVRSVGLLDLETAVGAPAELDVAVAQVLHGPLFSRPLPRWWTERFLAGYGEGLDAWALAYFRAYHLVNQGFYSALVGHPEHAEEVGRALVEEVSGLDS